MSWPFLRVLFAGTEEEVRPRHLGIVVLCAIATVWIATIAVVDLGVYEDEIGVTNDRQAQTLSTQLIERLRGEFVEARRALVSGRARIAEGAPLVPRLRLDLGTDPLFEAYPYVSDLVQIGLDGKQERKWSRDVFLSPFSDVADRRYVQDLLQGQVLARSGGPSPSSTCGPRAPARS
jgi:hypothetical protein